MAIRVSWGHMEPNFGGRGGRRGLAMTPFQRAMVVSYRLSILTVTYAICNPFGRNLRSTVSNAQINRGWVIFAKISGYFPWSRPLMFGSAESEHLRLIGGREIIFEEFKPM